MSCIIPDSIPDSFMGRVREIQETLKENDIALDTSNKKQVAIFLTTYYESVGKDYDGETAPAARRLKEFIEDMSNKDVKKMNASFKEGTDTANTANTQKQQPQSIPAQQSTQRQQGVNIKQPIVVTVDQPVAPIDMSAIQTGGSFGSSSNDSGSTQKSTPTEKKDDKKDDKKVKELKDKFKLTKDTTVSKIFINGGGGTVDLVRTLAERLGISLDETRKARQKSDDYDGEEEDNDVIDDKNTITQEIINEVTEKLKGLGIELKETLSKNHAELLLYYRLLNTDAVIFFKDNSIHDKSDRTARALNYTYLKDAIKKLEAAGHKINYFENPTREDILKLREKGITSVYIDGEEELYADTRLFEDSDEGDQEFDGHVEKRYRSSFGNKVLNTQLMLLTGKEMSKEMYDFNYMKGSEEEEIVVIDNRSLSSTLPLEYPNTCILFGGTHVDSCKANQEKGEGDKCNIGDYTISAVSNWKALPGKGQQMLRASTEGKVNGNAYEMPIMCSRDKKLSEENNISADEYRALIKEMLKSIKDKGKQICLPSELGLAHNEDKMSLGWDYAVALQEELEKAFGVHYVIVKKDGDDNYGLMSQYSYRYQAYERQKILKGEGTPTLTEIAGDYKKVGSDSATPIEEVVPINKAKFGENSEQFTFGTESGAKTTVDTAGKTISEVIDAIEAQGGFKRDSKYDNDSEVYTVVDKEGNSSTVAVRVVDIQSLEDGNIFPTREGAPLLKSYKYNEETGYWVGTVTMSQSGAEYEVVFKKGVCPATYLSEALCAASLRKVATRQVMAKWGKENPNKVATTKGTYFTESVFQAKVDKLEQADDLSRVAFSPQEREDAIEYIASIHSRAVDRVFERKKKELQKELDSLKNQQKEGINNAKAIEKKEKEVARLTRASVIRSEVDNVKKEMGQLLVYDNIRYDEEWNMRTKEERLKTLQTRTDSLAAERKAYYIKKGLSEQEADDRVYDEWDSCKEMAIRRNGLVNKILTDAKLFTSLYDASMSRIAFEEGYVITLEKNDSKKQENNGIETRDKLFGEEPSDEVMGFEEMQDQEALVKDRWMYNFREVSQNSSLSYEIKKMLSEIESYNTDGSLRLTTAGMVEHYEVEYTMRVINSLFKEITRPEEMMEALKRNAARYSWLSQVIQKLEGNETLKTDFYTHFRKAHVNYYVQYKDGDNVVSYQINKSESSFALTNRLKDTVESGTFLTDDHIYDKGGNFRLDVCLKLAKELAEMQQQSRGLRACTLKQRGIQARETVHESGKNVFYVNEDGERPALQRLIYIIKSCGIEIDEHEIIGAMSYDEIDTSQMNAEEAKEAEKQSKKNAREAEKKVQDAMNAVYGILTKGSGLVDKQWGIVKASNLEELPNKEETLNNPERPQRNLLNDCSTFLVTLSKNVNSLKEGTYESYVYELGKGYSSYVLPSYMDTVLTRLLDKDDDKRKQYIEENYLKYSWFAQQGTNGEKTIMNNVLEDLVAGDYRTTTTLKEMEHCVLAHAGKATYTQWDSVQYSEASFFQFFATPKNSHSNWVAVPILADAPSMEFIKLRSLGHANTGFKDVYKSVAKAVLQEYNRIALVQERAKRRENGEKIPLMKNFDKTEKSIGGAEFKFFPSLNRKEVFDKMKEWKENGLEGDTLIDKIAETFVVDMMEESFQKFLKGAEKTLLRKKADGTYVNKTIQKWSETHGHTVFVENDLSNTASHNTTLLEDRLRDYFFNSYLGTNNIIQLMTTDLAFYKDADDFFKRWKEVHSPTNKMYTEATWNGEKVGKSHDRSIYINDNLQMSKIGNVMAKPILDKVAKKELSEYKACEILSKLGYENHPTKPGYTKVGNVVLKTKKVNTTDAQSYRSLSSYRRVSIMSGHEMWDKEKQAAFERMKNGTWKEGDFDVVFQTLKMFAYGSSEMDSGLGDGTLIKHPMQHKNSELPLLIAMLSASQKETMKKEMPVLYALNELLEESEINGMENAIDAVHFSSVVKVGFNSSLEIPEGVKDADTIKNSLRQQIQSLGTAVHSIAYEDMGIITQNPEHFFETEILLGSQLRRLITSDMPNDAKIQIGDQVLTKEQWVRKYQELMTANIVESFKDLKNEFAGPDGKKNLSKYLVEEARNNSRYSEELVKACSLDKDGNFRIPLFDPIQADRIQAMLGSLLRKEVTKQKIKGGSCTQTTSFGLREDLKVQFKWVGEDGKATKTFYADEISEAELESGLKSGKIAIASYECMLPAWAEEMFTAFKDPETHEIDINKVPDELKEIVGYRIPTEAKYSMVPLKVRGFLPSESGSAIMLPLEITTIAGSDFDIDKLFIMLKETTTNEKGEVEAVNYSTDMSAFKMTREARNNMLIDLVRGAMTAPHAAVDMMTPGSSDSQKRAALVQKIKDAIKDNDNPNSDIIGIISESGNNLAIRMLSCEGRVFGTFDDMKKALHLSDDDMSVLKSLVTVDYDRKEFLDKQGTLNPKYGTISGIHTPSAVALLDILTTDELEEAYGRVRKSADILSPSTNVFYHTQNVIGTNLIAPYATHNVNNALLQLTKAEIRDENVVPFLGRRQKSLHDTEIELPDGTKVNVSNNIAGWLNASVDNVKEAVLAALNQSSATVDVTMYLARCGYNPSEISALLNQPIIKKVVEYYNSMPVYSRSMADAVRHVRDGYHSRFRELSEALGLGVEGYAVGYRKCIREVKDGGFETTLGELQTKAFEYSRIERLAEQVLDNTDDNVNKLTKEAYKDKIKEIKELNEDVVKDLKKGMYYQERVLGIFEAMIINATDLGDFTRAARMDTSNGTVGASISATENTIEKMEMVTDKLSEDLKLEERKEEARQKLKELKEKQANGEEVSTEEMQKLENTIGAKTPYKFAIRNISIFDTKIAAEEIEENFDKMMEGGKLPMMNAFYLCGLKGSRDILGKHFPQHSELFRKLKKRASELSKNGRPLSDKLIAKLYNSFFTYLLSGEECFKGDDIYTTTGQFINDMPLYLLDIKKQIYESEEGSPYYVLKNNKFLNSLFCDKKKGEDYFTIRVKNPGTISKKERQTYENDWAALLSHESEEIRALAVNLFKYSYYQNGMNFGYGTFSHLAPIVIREQCPGYIHAVDEVGRKVMNGLYPEDVIEGYFEQFCRHNHTYSNLVPVIDRDDIKGIIEDDKGHLVDAAAVQLYGEKSKKIQEVLEMYMPKDDSEYPPIIKVTDGNRKYLYLVSKIDENTISLTRTHELGVKNKLVEYNMDKHGVDMESVVGSSDFYRGDALLRAEQLSAKKRSRIENSIAERGRSEELQDMAYWLYDDYLMPIQNPTSEVPEGEDAGSQQGSGITRDNIWKALYVITVNGNGKASNIVNSIIQKRVSADTSKKQVVNALRSKFNDIQGEEQQKALTIITNASEKVIKGDNIDTEVSTLLEVLKINGNIC